MLKLMSLALVITGLALAGCSDTTGPQNRAELQEGGVEQTKPKRAQPTYADSTHRVAAEYER